MKTVKCTFWVDVPFDVSKEDIEDWVKFELNQTAQIKLSNPLSDTEIDAKNVIVDLFN